MSRIIKQCDDQLGCLYYSRCDSLPKIELTSRLLSVMDMNIPPFGDVVYFTTTWGDYVHNAGIIELMFSDWCIFNNVKQTDYQKRKFFVQFFESSEFYTPTVEVPLFTF